MAVVLIFITAVILIFTNHVNEKIYGELEEKFEADPSLNATTAHEALQTIHDIEKGSTWDWVFLAIFIGLNIQMLVLSFASRSNAAFFWIFVVLGLIILIIAVILSNTWQTLAENAEFSTTITRFPITNSLLGSKFPMIIMGITYLFMITLFGKFPGQQEQ